MVKIDLKLGRSTKEEYTEIKHTENNYKFWREHRKNWNQTFFMVPSEVLSYVSSIKSRAMSLYLYYSYRAGNNTGKSWASVERAAEELAISTKSVNNWNNELESLGLIARISEGRSSKTTYLLPVTDFFYFEKDTTPEKYISYSNKKIDGDLIGIFHLFQWRKKEANEYTKPYNVICLVFQRKYEADETSNNKKQFIVNKAVLFEEEEYKDIRINKTADEFSSSQGYKFKTKIKQYKELVPTIGIALTSGIDLKEIKKDSKVTIKDNEVIDLIKQLVEGLSNDTLKDLPQAEIVEEKK